MATKYNACQGRSHDFSPVGKDTLTQGRFPPPKVYDELNGLLSLLSPGALSTGEQEPPSKVKSLLLAVVIFEHLYYVFVEFQWGQKHCFAPTA